MLDTGLKPFLLVVAAFALILVNALWVTAEFAIVRVRRTRLEELSGQGEEAAKNNVERFLLSLAPLLRAAHFIFKPLLRVLERLSSWILQVLRRQSPRTS